MNIKWTVQVLYQTCSDYNVEDVENYIDLTWEDLSLAKEFFKSIKEHYDIFRELDLSPYRRGRTDNEVIEDIISRKWCMSKGVVKNNMPLSALCDDGEYRVVPTYRWCGYFERLLSAKVFPVTSYKEDDGMYIDFYGSEL